MTYSSDHMRSLIVQKAFSYRGVEAWNRLQNNKKMLPGLQFKSSKLRQLGSVVAPRGGLGGLSPSNNSAKIVKENGIKLVGYTFRLKNCVKIPPPPLLLDFSELAPPLVGVRKSLIQH